MLLKLTIYKASGNAYLETDYTQDTRKERDWCYRFCSLLESLGLLKSGKKIGRFQTEALRDMMDGDVDVDVGSLVTNRQNSPLQ